MNRQNSQTYKYQIYTIIGHPKNKHSWNFWVLIHILAKNRNVCKSSKFWSKIDILVENRNFRFNRFFSNADFFGRKSPFLVEN